MICLTPTVVWNHLKGGVDIMARILKTPSRNNMSRNPVVSICWRLSSRAIISLLDHRQLNLIMAQWFIGWAKQRRVRIFREHLHIVTMDTQSCATLSQDAGLTNDLPVCWQSNGIITMAVLLTMSAGVSKATNTITPMFPCNAVDRCPVLQRLVDSSKTALRPTCIRREHIVCSMRGN